MIMCPHVYLFTIFKLNKRAYPAWPSWTTPISQFDVQSEIPGGEFSPREGILPGINVSPN